MNVLSKHIFKANKIFVRYTLLVYKYALTATPRTVSLINLHTYSTYHMLSGNPRLYHTCSFSCHNSTCLMLITLVVEHPHTRIYLDCTTRTKDKRKICWAVISTTFSILSSQLDRVVVVVVDSAEIHQIETSWDNGWCGVRLFRSISRDQHRVSGCQRRWDPRFDWCRTRCTTACCSDRKRKSIWCPVWWTDGWVPRGRVVLLYCIQIQDLTLLKAHTR